MKKYVSKFLLLLTICILPIFLLSCLVPEKFDVKIKVNKNGTYSFVYDGILTDMFVRAAAVEKKGKGEVLSKKEVKEYEKEILRDKKFKEAKYIGGGRFKVLYKDEGNSKASINFMDIIYIWPGKDKKILISGKKLKLDEKSIRDFKELDMKIDGTIEVTTDAKVIKHNATSTPWFFGLFGGYKWKIKSATDPAPEMVIQLP